VPRDSENPGSTGVMDYGAVGVVGTLKAQREGAVSVDGSAGFAAGGLPGCFAMLPIEEDHPGWGFAHGKKIPP
jgi:hypothetical protein